MSDRLFIVIPAYNEEANIESVIDEWYGIVEKYGTDSRLVIVNDGSRDNTYEMMKEAAKTRERLIPLTKENGGHGDTILYGYKYALENGADYIFQTDSDGQTLPEEFGPFFEEREKYDMLIGYRNNRKDGISRVFVTKVLKLVIKMCFKVNVTDANTPYRLMKREALMEEIKLVPEHFFLSNVLITVLFKKHGRQIKFIPITFRPRQGGVNSINLKRIFKIGKQAVKDFRNLNKTI